MMISRWALSASRWLASIDWVQNRCRRMVISMPPWEFKSITCSRIKTPVVTVPKGVPVSTLMCLY